MIVAKYYILFSSDMYVDSVVSSVRSLEELLEFPELDNVRSVELWTLPR